MPRQTVSTRQKKTPTLRPGRSCEPRSLFFESLPFTDGVFESPGTDRPIPAVEDGQP